MATLSWYERITISIFKFLSAQETLSQGFSTDLSTCSMMDNAYEYYSVWPVADCYFFTSAEDLRRHAAYNTPVTNELEECRKMVQINSTTVQAISTAAERCTKETFNGIFPYGSRSKLIGSCKTLAGYFSNHSHSLDVISEKLGRIRTFQRVKPKKGEIRAIADSCNISDEYVANHTLAGKEINKILWETIENTRDDAQIFVNWFQTITMNEKYF